MSGFSTELIRSPYGLLETERWGKHHDVPDLLMIHGFGGSVRLFHQLIPHLTAAGYSGLSVSMPYHGDSTEMPSNPPAFNLSNYCQWLNELIPDSIQHLIAHSMGARPVLYLSAHQPKRFNSIHLIAPGGFYHWEIRMFNFFGTSFGQKLLDVDLIGNQTMKFLFPGASDKKLRQMRALMKYYGEHYDGMDLHKTETMHRLCLIEGIVHLIGGENDYLLPPSFYQEMKQHFMNSKVDIIAETGHLPMIQDPLLLSDALKAQLTKVRQW